MLRMKAVHPDQICVSRRVPNSCTLSGSERIDDND
jgi:hypothetical protein